MANQSKLIDAVPSTPDISVMTPDRFEYYTDMDSELGDSDKENEDVGTVEEVVKAEHSRREFTYRERLRVHFLRELGWTMRQISNHTNISLGSVHHICNNPATPKKRRTGRPLTLNTPIRKKLIDFVQQSAVNRRMTFPEVAFHCGKNS